VALEGHPAHASAADPSLFFAGITFYPEVVPATFVVGGGLTPFKRYSEYLVIVLLCLALAGYWRRMVRTGTRPCSIAWPR